MKKFLLNLSFLVIAITLVTLFSCGKSGQQSTNNEYTVVIEGYDWGPAVSKVILPMGETVESVNMDDFTVHVERTSDCGEITNAPSGDRTVVYAYISDKDGNRVDKGENVTLVLRVAPNLRIGHPYESFRSETCSGVRWVDYNMTITNIASGKVWNSEANRIMPLVDDFDLSGVFTHGDITMNYASFVPNTRAAKSPLFIWLTRWRRWYRPDNSSGATRLPNYRPMIQIFSKDIILVPQCPYR